jgi:hypothetical protein
VLPDEWRMPITIGDMEHFFSYITEDDVKNIAGMGLDHIRLGFDQIVLEEADKPYVYREEIFGLLKDFVGWCEKYDLRPRESELFNFGFFAFGRHIRTANRRIDSKRSRKSDIY